MMEYVIMVVALIMFWLAMDHVLEWWIKWRPRKNALKQIRKGSRWDSDGHVWVVGDISDYVQTVAMHLEKGPTQYMMFSPDYVTRKMRRLPEQSFAETLTPRPHSATIL